MEKIGIVKTGPKKGWTIVEVNGIRGLVAPDTTEAQRAKALKEINKPPNRMVRVDPDSWV